MKKATRIFSWFLAAAMVLSGLATFAPAHVHAAESDSAEYIHNFTENGLSSSFYTISGNLSSSKGTVSYNGLTLTQCLKMEQATSITFTAPSAGTLTLVFHETGYNGAIANQSTVKVDGSAKSVGLDNTLVLSLEAGSHTIKKGNKQIFLYYMVYAPASSGGDVHEHSYLDEVTAEATCGTAGERSYSCECGDSYTEPIPATGNHSYVGGKCSVCGLTESKGAIIQEGGWFESAYVVWESVSGASGYNVYVQASGASAWTKLDDMLVRQYPSYWRADALGLKAGSYTLKVVPVIGGAEKEAFSLTSGTLKVIAHDRSGYAFVSGASLKGGQTVTTSSGAYNDDGTLKSNAVVIYVTNDNKNTVTATLGGTTYTGLSNILATSVLKKATTPICVRLIGNITDLASGSAFDKGDLLIDTNGKSFGLTIEGVGCDATCNGFGIRIKNSSNVEIRNLAVMNCDSSEGDSIGLQQANDHIWVHNCDLFYGHAGSDADQVKGDGALDTKKSHYVTHSYNHFWDTGKSNLQGGSKSDTSDNITYHHNWYDHSDSRHPRVRVATVHVYNNYYDGVSKYGIGAAYISEVISEGNYFRNTKNPMLISTMGTDKGVNTMSGETPGTLTSYKDYVVGAKSWIPNVSGIQGATSWNASSYDCVIVDTRYDAYTYQLQSAEEAKETVIAYAGRINHGDFIWRFNNSVDDTSYDVNTGLKSALNSYKGSVISAGGIAITSGNGGNGTVSGGATPGAPQGAAVSGSYEAFGEAADSITIALIPAGAEEAAYTFTNAAAPAASGTWSIAGVEAGSYSVQVSKKNHVTREYTLTVTGSAAALDVEIWLIGDVTGDGLVNFSDYSKVLSQSKKPNSQILTDYAFLCGDVNADGAINFSDYSKVLSQAKGKGSLWQ